MKRFYRFILLAIAALLVALIWGLYRGGPMPKSAKEERFTELRNRDYQQAKQLAQGLKEGDSSLEDELLRQLLHIANKGLLSDWLVATSTYLNALPHLTKSLDLRAELHTKLLRVPDYWSNELAQIAADNPSLHDECVWLDAFFKEAFAVEIGVEHHTALISEIEERAIKAIASKNEQLGRFYYNFPSCRPISNLFLRLRDSPFSEGGENGVRS